MLLQSTSIQFIDNAKSFFGRIFYNEYFLIIAKRSSTTSYSNCSIDIVGVEEYPANPDITSLYIADANSFTIIVLNIKRQAELLYLPWVYFN